MQASGSRCQGVRGYEPKAEDLLFEFSIMSLGCIPMLHP